MSGPRDIALLNPAFRPDGLIMLWHGKATRVFDEQAGAGAEHPHAQP
jgi:hypothetical protein